MGNPFRWRGAFEFERLLPKKSPVVNAIIRSFCVAALPDYRGEVVETAPRCGCGSDALPEPIIKGLFVGRPLGYRLSKKAEGLRLSHAAPRSRPFDRLKDLPRLLALRP